MTAIRGELLDVDKFVNLSAPDLVSDEGFIDKQREAISEVNNLVFPVDLMNKMTEHQLAPRQWLWDSDE